MCVQNLKAVLDLCNCQQFDADVPVFGGIEVDYTEATGWKPGQTWWALSADDSKKIFYKMKLQHDWGKNCIPVHMLAKNSLSGSGPIMWVRGEESVLGKEAVDGWAFGHSPDDAFCMSRVFQPWTNRKTATETMYVYDFENFEQINLTTKMRRKIRVVQNAFGHEPKRRKLCEEDL